MASVIHVVSDFTGASYRYVGVHKFIGRAVGSSDVSRSPGNPDIAGTSCRPGADASLKPGGASQAD
jgi:hypothetical protein